MVGTQLVGVYSQIDVKGFSPLTLMAATVPKLLYITGDVLCMDLTHPRDTCRLLGIKHSNAQKIH